MTDERFETARSEVRDLRRWFDEQDANPTEIRLNAIRARMSRLAASLMLLPTGSEYVKISGDLSELKTRLASYQTPVQEDHTEPGDEGSSWREGIDGEGD